MLDQRQTKRSQTSTLVAVQIAVLLSDRGKGYEWGHRVLLETGSRLFRHLIVAQITEQIVFLRHCGHVILFLYFYSTET